MSYDYIPDRVCCVADPLFGVPSGANIEKAWRTIELGSAGFGYSELLV